MTVVNCPDADTCTCACTDCFNKEHDKCYRHHTGCHIDCSPQIHKFGGKNRNGDDAA